MRLFIGIPLPSDIAFVLSLVQGGIVGARWEPAENLHLTLRFVGEVDGGTKRRIEAALAAVDAEPWSMTLAGTGHFPPRGKPRSLWAGVADERPLRQLHQQIERALAPLGLPPDPRNFAPHVTVARLRDAPPRDVADFLTRHALLASAPFVVDGFALVSSIRSPKGSKYRIERAYRWDGATL